MGNKDEPNMDDQSRIPHSAFRTPHSEEPLSFGSWLKQSRRSCGFTQEDLAFAVDCSLYMIQKLETGKRRPSRQLTELLARYFGVAESDWPDLLRLARGVAAASSDAPQGHAFSNLPAQLTPIIGREREVATGVERLIESKARLLTLVGSPGIGKTRLAIQIAEELVPHFQDGICFVALASITDPALVPTAIAEALAVKDAGELSLESVVRFLKGRQMLLVLDNFEQVVSAATCVTRLLAQCPLASVVVTSREALRMHGEQQLPVPPLAFPAAGDLSAHLDRVSKAYRYPAVVLFVEVARALKPEFLLTADNVDAVRAICEHLDGVPLAIELAAARTRMFSPQALLTRLEQQLPLLATTDRDVPARHRTLRHAIAWSYDLLDAGERALFERLGVFAGGCTLVSVEVVCNARGDLPMDVLDGLASLLDKSLLLQQQKGKTEKGGEPRFTMLEAVREYARERLEASGEADRIELLRAEYFLALARQAQALSPERKLAHRLDTIDAEHNNIRAALDWAGRSGHIDLGLEMLGTLSWFWEARNHYTEGLQLCAWLLTLPGGVDPGARARALQTAGYLATTQNKNELAAAWLDEGLEIWRKLGDRDGAAWVLRALAGVACRESDFGLSRRYAEESLAIRTEAGNRAGVSSCYNFLGELARLEGDYSRARFYYELCMQIDQEIGDELGVLYELQNLGNVALHQGELQRATDLFQSSLSMAREANIAADIAYSIAGLATVSLKRLQHVRAARLMSAANNLLRSVDVYMDPADQAEYERNLAVIRSNLDTGAWEAAWAEGQGMNLEVAIETALDYAVPPDQDS